MESEVLRDAGEGVEPSTAEGGAGSRQVTEDGASGEEGRVRPTRPRVKRVRWADEAEGVGEGEGEGEGEGANPSTADGGAESQLVTADGAELEEGRALEERCRREALASMSKLTRCERVVQGQPVVWVKPMLPGRLRCAGEAAEWQEELSSISLQFMLELGYEAQVGAAVAIEARVLGRRWRGEVQVVKEVSPTFVMGQAMRRCLTTAGVQWEPRPAEGQGHSGLQELPEGTVVAGRVEFGDRETLWRELAGEGGQTDEHGVAEFWEQEERIWEAKIEEETARAAAPGPEQGGLLGGADWGNKDGLLAHITTGLREFVAAAEERVRVGAPSGPDYPVPPECNPPKYRDRVQEFESGSLHHEQHVRAWEQLDPPADPEVLDWVRNQYEVRVGPEGKGIRKKNGQVARAHWDDHQTLVLKLLRQGSWEVVPAGSTANILPMNLADKPGAEPPWRIINNAMDLNEQIPCKWPIRYEGVQTLSMVLTPGCWGFTMDLKDGYYALWLRAESRRLFGAELKFSKENIEILEAAGVDTSMGVLQVDGTVELTMQPRGLVMGFCNSCAVFTRLTRVLTTRWRGKFKYRCVHMMDDFCFVANTKEAAEAMREQVLRDLEELGFYVSWGKSMLEPSQKWKFLGFVVDTVQMRLFVPGDKIERVEDLVRVVLREQQAVSLRTLMRVTGKVISMGAAILPARLFTRETYKIIRPKGADYDATVQLTEPVVRELTAMLTELRVWNQVGKPVRRHRRMTTFRAMTDAGTSAGWRLDGDMRQVDWGESTVAVSCDWDEADEELFQVQKELRVIHRMLEVELEEVGPEGGQSVLVGQSLLVLTDCRGVKAYLDAGMGTSDVLTGMMRAIWWLCLRHSVALSCEWVPGSQMVQAGVDGLSRMQEFKLRPAIFSQLHHSRKWGRRDGFQGYTVDLYATEKTRQGGLPYCQRGGGGDSLGDARTMQLDPRELYWVCPPIPLIEATLQRLQDEGVAATVVVPHWRRQAWLEWLERYAEEKQLLEWSSWPATVWDVSEATVKPHLVNKWQMVAYWVDFRPAVVEEDPEAGGQGQGMPDDAVQVLSMCDGMGMAALALHGLGIRHQTGAIEIETTPALVAAKVPGVDHLEPGDLRKWIPAQPEDADRVRLKGRLQHIYGEKGVQLVVCGFPCQDTSPATHAEKGLGGSKTSLVRWCVEVLRAVLDLWPTARFIFECSVSQKMVDTGVLGQLDQLIGVKAQPLDARVLTAARRRRYYWVNFPVTPLQHWRRAWGDGLVATPPAPPSPEEILLPGRVPMPEWKDKLPTVVASGPRSWNMTRVVYDEQTHRVGPLQPEEFEGAMGVPVGWTQYDVLGEEVHVMSRYHMVGNGFAIPIIQHLQMCALESLGIITRNDVRQDGVIFTVNQDGPAEQWDAAMLALQEAAAGGAGPRRRKKARHERVRERMGQGHNHRRRPTGEVRPTVAEDLWGGDLVPQLRVLTREQGRDHVAWQQDNEGMWQHSLGDLRHDFLVLSRAPNTWKNYGAWWQLFVTWCDMCGVQLGPHSDVQQLGELLEESVVGLGTMYTKGTIENYLAAVALRFRYMGWGDIWENGLLRELLKGIDNWRGQDGSAKKLPVTAGHIAHILQMDTPEGFVWSTRGWDLAVAILVLAFMCGLRSVEVLRMSCCDIRWNEKGAEVAVNRTKNDQGGHKRTSFLEYAEKRELCGLRYLRRFMVSYGYMLPRPGCTNSSHPTLECQVCPRLFENVQSGGGVKNLAATRGMAPYRVTFWVQKVYQKLCEAGLVPEADLPRYTSKSARVGAVSAAAAAGVEGHLAADHLRMLAESTLRHYKRQLPVNRGAVSRALHRTVAAAAQGGE